MLLKPVLVECCYCGNKFKHIKTLSVNNFSMSEEEFDEICKSVEKEHLKKCPECGKDLNTNECRQFKVSDSRRKRAKSWFEKFLPWYLFVLIFCWC